MNTFDVAYNEVLHEVLEFGVEKGDRTGTGTLSRFGAQARFDLTNGRVPIISTRKIFTRSFIHEILWFISGSTDIEYLKTNNVSIWDSWVKPGTGRFQTLTVQERSTLIPKLGDLAIQQWADHVASMIPFEPSDEGKILPVSPEIEAQNHAFLDSLGIPRKMLVGGSIGTGAYGAMWRRYPDTRIVSENDLATYVEDRGYEHRGRLDTGVPFGTDTLHVVHRDIDQLQNVIDLIRNNPDSRRIMLVAYNPAMVEDCVLPPCHSLVQWWTRELTDIERSTWVDVNVRQIEQSLSDFDYDHTRYADHYNAPKRALSCQLYARSQDYAVGSVSNIAEYGLLTQMIAHVTNTVAEEFIWTGGDVHIYDTHHDGVQELLRREGHTTEARVVFKRPITNIDDFTFSDIVIMDYQSDGVIKFPIAV